MNHGHHSRFQLGNKGRVAMCDTIDTSSTGQNYLIHHLLVVNWSVWCAKVNNQLCTGGSSRLRTSAGRRGISGFLEAVENNSTHHHIKQRETRERTLSEKSNLAVRAKRAWERVHEIETTGWHYFRIKKYENLSTNYNFQSFYIYNGVKI